MKTIEVAIVLFSFNTYMDFKNFMVLYMYIWNYITNRYFLYLIHFDSLHVCLTIGLSCFFEYLEKKSLF